MFRFGASIIGTIVFLLFIGAAFNLMMNGATSTTRVLAIFAGALLVGLVCMMFGKPVVNEVTDVREPIGPPEPVVEDDASEPVMAVEPVVIMVVAPLPKVVSADMWFSYNKQPLDYFGMGDPVAAVVRTTSPAPA